MHSARWSTRRADYLKFIERDEDAFHTILGQSFRTRVERIQQHIASNPALTDEQKSMLYTAWVMFDSLRLKLALRPSILHPTPLASDGTEMELLWNPHLIELHVDFEEPQLMGLDDLKDAIEQIHLTANKLQQMLTLLS